MSNQSKLYIVVDTSFEDVGFHCAQAVHAAMCATRKWNLDAERTVVILESKNLLEDFILWETSSEFNPDHVIYWCEPDYDNKNTAMVFKPGHAPKRVANLPLLREGVRI